MLQSLRKRVLSPSALALLLHRASRACQARHLLFVARAVMLLGRFLTGIEINTGAVIGRDLRIKHGMGTVIGGHCRIGDDCVLFHNVTLGQAGPDGGMPTLGNRVIVYAGAVIAGPISIGDDAIIGANAVVLTDVPAGATVGGVPAKPVHGDRPVGVHEPVS